MSESRNIALLLTAPQPAAIAVVRLVGPLTDAFLAKHFDKPLTIGRCVHGKLKVGDEIIDDPLVVRQAHYADVNLHGGSWIVRAFLDLAERFGFEIHDALAIPLPADAVEGTTAIDKAVLAAVPLGTTELALQRLLEQISAWQGVDDLKTDVQAMLEDYELWWLLHPPTVAIAGIANVGKSTLANQLFAQERSITADMPGTTRDWVGDIANVHGLAVHLIDTPGIRETDDSIEAKAIAHASEQLLKADLILLMLDATVPLREQQHLLDRYPAAVRIVNKSDRGTLALDAIRTVATKGIGVDQVQKAIADHFQIGRRPGKVKWWTQEQRMELRQKHKKQ